MDPVSILMLLGKGAAAVGKGAAAAGKAGLKGAKMLGKGAQQGYQFMNSSPLQFAGKGTDDAPFEIGAQAGEMKQPGFLSGLLKDRVNQLSGNMVDNMTGHNPNFKRYKDYSQQQPMGFQGGFLPMMPLEMNYQGPGMVPTYGRRF